MKEQKRAFMPKKLKIIYIIVLACIAVAGIVHTAVVFIGMAIEQSAQPLPTTSFPPYATLILLVPYTFAALLWGGIVPLMCAIFRRRG